MRRSLDFPFQNGQWRLSLGLKPLSLNDWIDIDHRFAEELQQKARLLADRPGEWFGDLPDSIAAQQEVLDLLVAHLDCYPQHYQRQGDRLHNCVTGETWRLGDFADHPLDLAGRLVQEDLCLLLRTETGYILMAGSVCFPSRWRLRDKLGRSLATIHDPVPGYAEKLSHPVDRVFDRLRADYPGYRYNWSIVDTPELCLQQPHGEATCDPTITVENAGDRLYLRVERQTLRRLPQTGGVLFTIRTYVEPLSHLVSTRSTAIDLANAIEQMPAAMHTYKNLTPLQPMLLHFLRRH